MERKTPNIDLICPCCGSSFSVLTSETGAIFGPGGEVKSRYALCFACGEEFDVTREHMDAVSAAKEPLKMTFSLNDPQEPVEPVEPARGSVWRSSAPPEGDGPEEPCGLVRDGLEPMDVRIEAKPERGPAAITFTSEHGLNDEQLDDLKKAIKDNYNGNRPIGKFEWEIAEARPPGYEDFIGFLREYFVADGVAEVELLGMARSKLEPKEEGSNEEG